MIYEFRSRAKFSLTKMTDRVYFITALGFCKTTLNMCSVGTIPYIFLWIKYYFHLCIENASEMYFSKSDIYELNKRLLWIKLLLVKLWAIIFSIKIATFDIFSQTNQFAPWMCLWQDDDDDDNELFLWYGWPTKGV